MSNYTQTIEAVETFIRINGDRFKLYYLKYGMKGEKLPFRKITQIEQQYGSVSDYIAEFIEDYSPESIEVVTKKPNGSSHGIKPTSKVFHLKEDMTESTSNNQLQPLSITSSLNGLSGVEKIHSLETTLLNRELQKETNRAERYEGLYHDLREKHFELEKDHKLLKDKTELEREKERLQNENSLSSVIKEVKPELFGLLGNMVQPNANQSQPTALQGTENEKIGLLTETLSQLPEEMQTEAIEVLVRYLNSDATQRGKVLGELRTTTEELNEQINELLTA